MICGFINCRKKNGVQQQFDRVLVRCAYWQKNHALQEKNCALSYRGVWHDIWFDRWCVCTAMWSFFLILLWIRANCRIFNLKFNCKLYIGNFLCIFFELIEFFPLVSFALEEHFLQSSCMYYINIIEAVYRFKPINILVLNGIIDEKSE